MKQPDRISATAAAHAVTGEFVDLDGERYYLIRNVDGMPPFFISVISGADHWLFVSSTGGLTAGRVSPQTALFPYLPVDKVHDSWLHTGSRTLLRVGGPGGQVLWEPFNREQDGRFRCTRNLYKSTLGDRLRFEEINHDLGLAFHYTWTTSPQYGFVRRCELRNLTDTAHTIELLDGLQNILPAGTPDSLQATASNLVNAYKWTELDAASGLAMYALYSGISDRPQPFESLRANVAYCLGLDAPTVLLSSLQLDVFRRGGDVAREDRKRGIRGAYFVTTRMVLSAGGAQRWEIVADIERTQGEVVDLIRQLDDPARAAQAITGSVEAGRDDLARIVGAADGFQGAAEENVTAHHCANVLFNVLRGGIFDDQYRVSTADFAWHVAHFNSQAHARHRELLRSLPAKITSDRLLAMASESGDPQLERLCYEYLPITFGRRHGDPSRPWNRFTIRVRDADGSRLLSFEGNWRDIFQNWEALLLSYPEYVEFVVAKFVNASTVDGYNPYRITRQGIDWEVAEPDNPWSHIGYWGDHQIIYLLKLLELSRQFHPDRLQVLLRRPVFSYANVPYRIRDFAALVRDPKNTVDYDHALAARIAERVATVGADGKLVVGAGGDVHLVNLLEKLLVPLLAKLGNFVVDVGIWLNTQRPEWNDANNALVGQGVSMVTVYYLRRYVHFLRDLLAGHRQDVELSIEVAEWLTETATAFAGARPSFGAGQVSAEQRWGLLEQLGSAAGRYRASVYRDRPFSGTTRLPLAQITALLDDTLAAVDHTIGTNLRDDGFYNAYNLVEVQPGAVRLDTLYLMLEGQVAALSSGAIAPEQAAALLDNLFQSDIYRPDQRSFMLYPDRALPGFLEKNRIAAEGVEAIPLLRRMLAAGDQRVVTVDASGCHRFNADFTNVDDLEARLDALVGHYGQDVAVSRGPLRALYEQVFRHREFTGRSGGMFGFEGLGCIYWHMVSKLLLAVQENYFAARDGHADDATCRRLGDLYYRVRDGIGFNKTPAEYGAFPTDPYSHTPGHGGARQPGMTGQVKEEVLTRFGELGLRVRNGMVQFEPALLRGREFAQTARAFRYVDVDGVWQEIEVPAEGLAYTWCQVPVVYRRRAAGEPSVTVILHNGSTQRLSQASLPVDVSRQIFDRTGRVRQVIVDVPADLLLRE